MSRYSRRNPQRINLINQPAGFASRTVAMLIDIVAISLGLSLFTYLTTVVFAFFGFDTVIENITLSQPSLETYISLFLLFGALAVLTFTNITYFVFLWSLDGQTIGMALLGIRVISVRRADGDVRVIQALIRYGALWLCMLPLMLGFVWIFINDERRGWHDLLSGTQVLYAWEARPDEHFLQRLMRQSVPELPPPSELE
jgi:uncharacterized RDD family membrane protein YckC